MFWMMAMFLACGGTPPAPEGQAPRSDVDRPTPAPSAPRTQEVTAAPGAAPRAEDVAPRSRWLAEALRADNTVWGARPELVTHKLRRMASKPYDYMRGTVALYPLPEPEAGLDWPRLEELSPVLIVADPHPENFGCFLRGDPTEAASWRVEINDFDGAAFGPWLHDVMRAAVGLRLIASQAHSCDATCQRATTDALASGYAAEIDARSAGRPGIDPSDGAPSKIAARLLTRCAKRHGKAKRWSKQTTGTVDRPTLKRDTALSRAGKGVLDLSDDESAQVARLTAQLAARSPGLEIVDAARLYGRGVSSVPALRYVVIATPPAPEPPMLLLLREVVAIPTLPYLRLPAQGPFATAASRIEAAPRAMWSRTDNDPYAFGLTDGDTPFKSQRWGSAFEGFSHEDILADLHAGRTGASDLPALGRHLGALLAGHHARGTTLDGAPALPIITSELSGGPHALAQYLGTAGAALVAQIEADAALLGAVDGDLDALGGAPSPP